MKVTSICKFGKIRLFYFVDPGSRELQRPYINVSQNIQAQLQSRTESHLSCKLVVKTMK